MFRRILHVTFNRENGFALMLCLIVLLVIVVTASSAPQWIYQGF